MSAVATRRKTADERFAEKLEAATTNGRGCTLWSSNKNGAGYGLFWDGTRKVCAHRFAWERKNGPIAEGLWIDHLCRNPLCVNTDHLEPVTPAENTLRGLGPSAVRARAAAITHCKHGHPFDEQNTYYRKSGGLRACRTCQRGHSLRQPPARRGVCACGAPCYLGRGKATVA